MLTKDIKALPVGTELVVTSKIIRRSAPKDKRAPHNIRETDAHIGTLVSYDTYRETYYHSQTPYSPDFVITTQDKVKRFLIKFVTSAGTDSYYVIPTADIICTKAEVEKRWEEERLAKQVEEAQRNRKAEAERAVEDRRKATEENLRQAVHAVLTETLGANWQDKRVRAGYLRTMTNVHEDSNGNLTTTFTNTGDVELPVDLFLRMVHVLSER